MDLIFFRCYEINDDVHEPYLIFEDLTCQNYKNVDRRIGLSVAECMKALSKIARWHAATIVLLEETVHTFLIKFENRINVLISFLEL